MEYNNYLGWIYPKTKDIVSTEDVSNIIQLQKGQPGGIATLDGAGKVPSDQLPSYVDDVLQFDSIDIFPNQGESDKIYLDTQTNLSYRWTGSTYLLIGGLSNLINGRGQGSVKSIYATQEDGNYSLGNYAVALGKDTKASGEYSYAEGSYTIASANYAHAEGLGSRATAAGAHAEGGGGSEATATNAHAEGGGTVASGAYSHSEGGGTRASGSHAHAEGGGTTASGNKSHAEGGNTVASGDYSHAEGYSVNDSVTASGEGSHAEGCDTTASGQYSHSEGHGSLASGSNSHAEGVQTIASGINSHAGGIHTTAQRKSQTAIGEYNILDTQGTTTTRGKYAFIIGNGNSTTRSNALAVTWDGNVQIAGTPVSSNHLATKLYVDTNIIDLEDEIEALGTSIGSISPVVFFNYSINASTGIATTDFTFNQIRQAMDADKVVYIKWASSSQDISSQYESESLSQIRVTEYDYTSVSGDTTYSIYTEDSQFQFTASSPTALMTRVNQADPNPADRDPNDFS